MEPETIRWIFSIGGGFVVMSLTYFACTIINKRYSRAKAVNRLYSAIHADATRK